MTNGIWPNDGSHKYKEELETLRQSVRRLVGEWRKDMQKLNELSARNESNILGPAAKGSQAAIVKCISELSALIDGKDSKQEKL